MNDYYFPSSLLRINMHPYCPPPVQIYISLERNLSPYPPPPQASTA